VIVTRDFVFLHLHKSGGTFVNQFLLRHFPDAEFVGYHLPRARLPRACAGRPIFGLVRNPWDYYVSWYTFQAARSAPNPLFVVASDGGRLDFSATVRNLVGLGSDVERLSRVAASLPEEFPNRGINLTRRCLDTLAGSPHGFYSWLFERMFGDGSDVTFGRMETLREDLARFLASIGVPLEGARAEFLASQPPLNTSSHRPYAELYDADSRDLVASRDAPVIERFGYLFGTALDTHGPVSGSSESATDSLRRHTSE
jgi:hypothetical protein